MGMELGVDLAVQKDDIFRRTKRLVCMDVDSTFVKGEFIDELAELVGRQGAGRRDHGARHARRDRLQAGASPSA